LCGCYSKQFSSSVENLELGQVPPYPPEGGVAADSLQYLAQNKIGQAEALLIQLSVEPISVRIRGATQIINPDGRVYDSHVGELLLYMA
jgi:hypothetical protein